MSNSNNESLLEFPCQFPIKIVGKASLEFQGEVLKVFRKHFASLSESAVHVRYSKENHYASMTITILAESQSQLDAIYRELSSNALVLMVL